MAKRGSPTHRIELVLNRLSRDRWLHPKKVERIVLKMTEKYVRNSGARGFIRNNCLFRYGMVGIINGRSPAEDLGGRDFVKLSKAVRRIKEEDNNFSGELACLEATIRNLK